MALTPLSKEKKNRILRNFAVLFSNKDIEKLNKYGYHFLNVCSGFIAHYNLHGFIAHYGSHKALAQDILRNQPANQWHNFSPSDKDYEYMMQKKEMYNQICEYAKGNFANSPSDEECFEPPNVRSLFEENKEQRKLVETAYRNHLAYGNYFNANDPQRVIDLADITMAYQSQVVENGKMKDNEFLNSEITTETEQTGTPSSLLNCYRDEIWEIFNEFSGRAIELGLDY